MSTDIHPAILIAAIAAVLILGPVIVACTVRSRGVRALAIALALVLLLPAGFAYLSFCPELVDGRFRTFKAFYRGIQIGMTRDEIFAELDRHYPTSGTRQRPKVMTDKPEELDFFMNPETSREPNCEGIFLNLEHGRVTKKNYSPD